jgi:hypothetical protein
MYTQIKALWNIPNGRELLSEICGIFGVEMTEELVNTRDCSSFVGNMLRNMVTMFAKQEPQCDGLCPAAGGLTEAKAKQESPYGSATGWTFEDLQKRIDKINVLNGA